MELVPGTSSRSGPQQSAAGDRRLAAPRALPHTVPCDVQPTAMVPVGLGAQALQAKDLDLQLLSQQAELQGCTWHPSNT